MKIAVVYPSAHGAAWGLSDGLVHTLRLMGNLVLDMPQNTYLPETVSWWKRMGEINQGDLLIISAPEYACWDRLYSGFDNQGNDLPRFSDLMAQVMVPTFGLYCETREREGFTFQFSDISGLFDHSFFPAMQDVEEMDPLLKDRCHWLPFGVDTTIFYPKGVPRTVPLGFVGSVYSKRKAFLDAMRNLEPDPALIPEIVLAPAGGTRLETTQILVDAYNRISVLACLPAFSSLLPNKVTEAMACGCCVLLPRLEGKAAGNMEEVEDRYSVVLYDPTPEGLIAAAARLRDDPGYANGIRLGAVTSSLWSHNLRKKLEFVLSKVEIL